MINLIKNELTKIFHRKGIYVLSIIILVFSILGVILNKVNLGNIIEIQASEYYYNMLESSLEGYDLNNKEEATWYVDAKVEIELHNLQKDLEYSSALYYYIDTEINSVLTNAYTAKYINKDEAEYESYKKEYDELVSNLYKYDWKISVKSQKDEVQEQIKQLEEYLSSTDTEEIRKEIESLEYQLKALEYRLNNDVAPSYSSVSYMVDSYEHYGITYSNLNKDESAYKDRAELIEDRKIISEFKEIEYKIENNIVPIGDYTLQNEITSFFSGTDTFILIAFLIIAGGIIAEEFNKGTIKQLLLRPFTRGKILTSKIIAALIATFLFAFFYYFVDILSFILSNSEFKSIFEPIIVYNFNADKVVEYSTFGYCFIKILAILPEYLMLFMICIFVGVLTTNTIACVISVFGVTFAGALIEGLLPEKISAFIPTSCMNFTEYLFGGLSQNQYQTLGSSIVIYIITIVIIICLTYVIFKKKDIKNQ